MKTRIGWSYTFGSYYQHGREARFNRALRTDCKYRKGWQRNAWMRGWNDMGRDLRKHLRERDRV